MHDQSNERQASPPKICLFNRHQTFPGPAARTKIQFAEPGPAYSEQHEYVVSSFSTTQSIPIPSDHDLIPCPEDFFV
jgi:hypothetical protein